MKGLGKQEALKPNICLPLIYFFCYDLSHCCTLDTW